MCLWNTQRGESQGDNCGISLSLQIDLIITYYYYVQLAQGTLCKQCAIVSIDSHVRSSLATGKAGLCSVTVACLSSDAFIHSFRSFNHHTWHLCLCCCVFPSEIWLFNNVSTIIHCCIDLISCEGFKIYPGVCFKIVYKGFYALL